MNWYTDQKWAVISAVLAQEGALLSAGDEWECRVVLSSAAATFSWVRRGLPTKEGDRIVARISTASRRVQSLQTTEPGSSIAMRLADELESDLAWMYRCIPELESQLSRIQAKDWRGYLTVIEIELSKLSHVLQREVGYHKRERPSRFDDWLSSLARIWEQSGLIVTASGGFPRFVEAARSKDIRGGVLTETTVRDFVLKKWSCRTAKSS